MAEFYWASVVDAHTAILAAFFAGEGVPVGFAAPERLDGSCKLLIDLEVAVGWIVFLLLYFVGFVDGDHLEWVLVNASVGFVGSFDLDLVPFAFEPECGIHVIGELVSLLW